MQVPSKRGPHKGRQAGSWRVKFAKKGAHTQKEAQGRRLKLARLRLERLSLQVFALPNNNEKPQHVGEDTIEMSFEHVLDLLNPFECSSFKAFGEWGRIG